MPNTGGISFDNLDSHAGKFTLTIREFNQVDDINQDNMDNGTIYRVIPDIVGTNFTDYIPFQSDKYYAWQVSIPLVSTDADPQHIPSLKSSWFVFKYSDILSTGGGATGGSSGTGIGMTTPGSITGGGSAGGTGEGTNGGTGEGTGSGSGSGVSGSSTGGTGSGSGSNGTVGGTTPENEIVIILTNLNNPQVSGLLNDGFVPTGNVYVGDQLYSGDGAILQLQKLAGKSIKSITMSDE